MVEYQRLNQYLSPDLPGISDAWKRTLGRLGDYTHLVVRTLNLRPTAVRLLSQNERDIVVRISLPTSHVNLRIAPEADLSGALFFGRMMLAHQLPAAQIIHHDLSRRMVPFAYLVESHISGSPATRLEVAHELRSAARQAGRILARMHRVHAPSWGRPGPLNRWTSRSWGEVLAEYQRVFAPPQAEGLVFTPEVQAAAAAQRTALAGGIVQPVLCHGTFGPAALSTTGGNLVRVEALVNPALWVGGDGLIDLAFGLAPEHPAAWREGLYEGYHATAPLSAASEARLSRLRGLVCYWLACRHYLLGLPYEAARDEAIALLLG